MANRYIAALLVVLTATGIEAYTYEAAVRDALTRMSYEEACLPGDAQELRNGILEIIKALKDSSNEDEKRLLPSQHAIDAITNTTTHNSDVCHNVTVFSSHNYSLCLFGTEVVIRGPDSCRV